MKYSTRLFKCLILLLGIITLMFSNCKEDITLPKVTTSPMLKITYSNILLGGYVFPKEGGSITSKGICWSLDTLPTIDDNKKIYDLTTFGSFEIKVTEFILDTIYYFRAFAINEAGVGYGEVMKFRTYCGTVTDIDGNIYIAIRIGSQIWMGEDLKVTKYQNNDPIPCINDNTQWSNLTTGAYCSPNNYLHEVGIYGLLYNFYAVKDSRKISPQGWHIPTTGDWQMLINYLGGDSFAGGKLKELGIKHWQYPNTGATNKYIFTALPGGNRSSSGIYERYNYFGEWWSSTAPQGSTGAFSFELIYNKSEINLSYNSFRDGLFIRCIKD